MKFCSIDIEADQPSNQIIQIGAIVYDHNGRVYDRFNKYIEVPLGVPNYACDLRGGSTLGELLPESFKASWEQYKAPREEVLKEFWNWVKNGQFGYRFIQWGTGDVSCIIKESKNLNIPITKTKVLDLKSAFQFTYYPFTSKKFKNTGLKTVLEGLIQTDGSEIYHCGFQDAIHTMKIHLEMLKCVRTREVVKGLI